MRFFSLLRQLIPAVVILAGLYWQLSSLHHPAFGLLLFALYFFIIGYWWKQIFESRFLGKGSGLVGNAYGFGAVFFLLGLFSSIGVVWYKLTPVVIVAAYSVTAAVSYLFWHVYAGSYPASQKQRVPDHVYFPGKSAFIFLFFLLWIAGMLFYAVDERSFSEETPWHVLGNAMWVIFFFLSAFIGIFIFSKIKAAIVLPMIVLFSFYTHLYIPASHQLPWGGDVWRLIAVEEKLLQGRIEPPVLFGPERTMRSVHNYAVPDALLVPHKYTYGHLWGTSVVIAKTLSLNLMFINKWLIPLVWSLLVPIIFYRTGTTLFDSRRTGLLFAWSSCLVFTLQAVGGLTLPVSLGTLTFFFVMSVLIESIKRKKRSIVAFLALFALLMFFGYILHALLFFMTCIAGGVLAYVQRQERMHTYAKKGVYVAGCVAALAFLPAVELLSKSGTLPHVFDIKKQVLQMIGQLSGWFYAVMIRPHDIASGNILFNHTPASAFVSRAPTVWRFHVLFVSLSIWLFALYGFFKVSLLKKSAVWQTIGVLSVAVVGGYIIGWYGLTGDRLFTRRLDPLMAYVLLLLSLYGMRAFIARMPALSSWPLRLKRVLLLAVVMACSWFGATAWLSGPDLRVAGFSEFSAAEFIAQDIQDKPGPVCVLADTWVLLVLEGLSAGRVVGGGFPIDYQFGQKERTELFAQFSEAPSSLVQEKIADVVEASSCYLVLQTDNIEVNNELGSPLYKNEESLFTIWKIDLKK